MSTATFATHTEHVSGPSTMVAFLRALYLKVTGALRTAWSHARVILSASLRLPASAATAMTALLSSEAGYASVTGGIVRFLSGLWRGITSAARFVGRIVGEGLRGLINVVGHFSPGAADALYGAFSVGRARITRIAGQIDSTVRAVGDLLVMLLNTTLVRTVATTVSAAAAAVLVVHEATSGSVVMWLAGRLPGLVRALSVVTSPWWCLTGVVGSTLGAMAVAFLRLLHAARKPGDGPEDDGPDDPAVVADWRRWQESLDDRTVDDLVKDLHISVAPDGSVSVSGIPDWVPANLRARLAKVAAESALKQWERTIRIRPRPSRDDRRLFTKAARDAVRTYASRTRSTRRTAA